MQVHTYGQAPARLIKVRASPDGPYQAVSTAPDAGPPTWASVAQQRGAPERLSGQPGPSSSVHYDAASGMWVSEGTEGDQGRHETPPKQPSAEGVRSPGQSTFCPFPLRGLTCLCKAAHQHRIAHQEVRSDWHMQAEAVEKLQAWLWSFGLVMRNEWWLAWTQGRACLHRGKEHARCALHAKLGQHRHRRRGARSPAGVA